MRSFESFGAALVIAIFCLAVSPVAGDCNIAPAARLECGYAGITQKACLTNASCCWNSTVSGVKWCFIDPARNPCNVNPCLNSGTCKPIDAFTYQCQCTAGFIGQKCDVVSTTTSTTTTTTTTSTTTTPTTTTSTTTTPTTTTSTTTTPTTTTTPRPSRPYTLNLTVDDQIKELYFDGVLYFSLAKYVTYLPNWGAFATKDTVNLPSQPSLIAISGYDAGGVWGMLASDSEGYVTDGSWKCTDQLYANWFATNYDDSAWSSAKVFYANGNRTSAVSDIYWANNPVTDINYRANWIWSQVYNTATRVAYCRFRVPTVTSCNSGPCKNGGVCTPYNYNAANYYCSCPSGTAGPDCSQTTTTYQLNVTSDDYLKDLFIDGRRYDIPNYLSWNIEGTLNLNYMPRTIAVVGYNAAEMFGTIASDSAGLVTGASWKCTKNYYTNWMLPDYDDSAWPTAWLESVNGDRLSRINTVWNGYSPIKDVSQRAYWIWPTDYYTGFPNPKNFGYCRAKLPTTGYACFSAPCKNGGLCTNTGPTYTCSCTSGFSGTNCNSPAQPYQLNITADDILDDLFIDGIRYDLTWWASWDLKDTINLDFMPKVVAVYAHLTAAMFGIIASDSAGFVTDGSWKCTQKVYADWMLPDYDDSAWPAAMVEEVNGNRTSVLNRIWHGWLPIVGISNRASWIWAQDYNATLANNYAHCRLRLPPSGNACVSFPCKNGGTCTNNGASFKCTCASGFSGTQCDSPSTLYQLSITADDRVIDLYLDGVRYDVPNADVYNVPGNVITNFKPKVVAVYAKDNGIMQGILASDTNGLLTGTGWKCTSVAYPNWMLVGFDDSAWPAAWVQGRNGDSSSKFNQAWNGGHPVAGISNDAYWIWATVFNTDPVWDYVYCRSPPLY
jgi:hypothetical protein